MNSTLTALFIGNSQFGVYNVPRMVMNLAEADMGQELGVPVVDACHAYYKFIGDPPSMERLESLFNIDRAHPGLWGSHLYACGIYSVLTGRCPIGLPIIPAKTLRSLQEAAWAQYLATAKSAPP